MAPAKDTVRIAPVLAAGEACPIGALHEQRLSVLEQRLSDHSDTLERIQGRLSQGDVSFAELRKDFERLTNEVRGIKSILAWVGAAIGGGVLSAGGAALLWALRSMPTVAAVLFVLTGCVEKRAERVQTTTTRQEVVVAPVELATPIGPISSGPIHIAARTHQEATERSRSETAVPSASVVPAVATSSNFSLGGVGLTGLLGVGGLAGAVVAWLSRQRAVRTLEQVVAGVEEAKASLVPDQRARLLEALDARMDSEAKKCVRDRRARL